MSYFPGRPLRVDSVSQRPLSASLAVGPLVAVWKVPTFDGHLNESNTDLRRCSMEYTPRRKLTREFKLEAVRQVALSEKPERERRTSIGFV